MDSFITWFLALIPSSICTAAGVYIFFKSQIKSAISKAVEKGVETYFDKQMERYKDSLGRKTKAFEMRLTNEFSAYQSILEFLSRSYIKTFIVCDALKAADASNYNASIPENNLRILASDTIQFKERVYKSLAFVNDPGIVNSWKLYIAKCENDCQILFELNGKLKNRQNLTPDEITSLETMKTEIDREVTNYMDKLKKHLAKISGEK